MDEVNIWVRLRSDSKKSGTPRGSGKWGLLVTLVIISVTHPVHHLLTHVPYLFLR